MLSVALLVAVHVVLTIPPVPSARVNDYVGILTASGRSHLEEMLSNGERETGAQMVVAIFDSLQGENLEDYSLRLANAWGVGRKGINDGVVLAIFLKDAKMRLEIGDGLRKAIPDAAASDILAKIIAPRFRAGQHLLGLQEGVLAIFQRIKAPNLKSEGGVSRGCAYAEVGYPFCPAI
jgi:uncharacterized protein